MLFKQKHLDGIKSGKISVAIRRWKKPAVKKGSLIKTAIGEVKIIDVEVIDAGDLNKTIAGKAGFETLDELQNMLDDSRDGDLYKISLCYHGEDPRIKLRVKSDLSDEEIEMLKDKLNRLDKFSSEGAWTKETLSAIKAHPMLRAVDLAKKLKREKDWLKINIRKLKNIGLTISHEVGYSLSPKGEALLKHLR